MTTIPIDVLLYIIEFIDHPKDLLSLALTARDLHAIIVPRHIDYRRISISCTKSSEHVWKHLLDTPHVCSSIRYLNILLSLPRTEVPRMCNFGTPPPPFDGRDNNLNHIFDTFIQALSKMVNLKVLKFETASLSSNDFCLISEAIGKAGCGLEELEVHFDTSNTAIEQHFEKDKVSKDLRTFSLFYDYLPSLRKYTIGSWYRRDSSVPLQMLLNAPNLTYMNVAFGLSEPWAFLSGYWPNLQQLKLYNYMVCPTGEDYLPCLWTFLRRHSKLITLSANNILHPGWAVESDDFLPNLKSFYMTLESYSPTITTNIAARLMYLKMGADLYRHLRERGIILSNLETCVFWDVDPEEFIQDLVEMVPNIQKLWIVFQYVWDINAQRRLLSDKTMEHVPFFASLKNLRVLIGLFDDINAYSSHPLFKILYDFPRLLYTRVGFGIIRLERDDIAKVMRFEHEEVCPDECNLLSWDNIYRNETDTSA